jgi:hypothetical protein
VRYQNKQLLAVALALLAAACMWYYLRGIVIPQQEKFAAQLDQPRGNLSDLYPRWLGARELLLHGRDPYSREITLEIQRGYYGREIDPARPYDPRDQQGFAYPVYVVFLLAPTVHMDFVGVLALSFWLLIGCTACSVLFWTQIVGVGFLPWRTLSVVLLVLGSYPLAEAVSQQQPALLVAWLLAAACLARQRGWFFLSGVLLAVATIKPQVALLPAILMLLWVSGGWRERRRWLWGFAATMLLLLGASEYVLPGWMFRFYAAVRAYSSYMAGTSFLDRLVGPRWSLIAGVIIVSPVLWACWKSRMEEAGTMASRRALCLVLVAVVCIAPTLAIYNQVLLVPGLLLAFDLVFDLGFDQRPALPHGRVAVRYLGRLTVALVAWPWVACASLVVAKVVFHAESLVRWAWQAPLYTTLSLPVALFALLLLLPSARVSSQQTSPRSEILA